MGAAVAPALAVDFVSRLPPHAVLAGSVELTSHVGHGHAVHAWFSRTRGGEGARDGVDFCVPGDRSMEASCRVASLWWRLNRRHLIKVSHLSPWTTA